MVETCDETNHVKDFFSFCWQESHVMAEPYGRNVKSIGGE